MTTEERALRTWIAKRQKRGGKAYGKAFMALLDPALTANTLAAAALVKSPAKETMTVEGAHNSLMTKLIELRLDMQGLQRTVSKQSRTAGEPMVHFTVQRYGDKVFKVPQRNFRNGPWVTWSEVRDE